MMTTLVVVASVWLLLGMGVAVAMSRLRRTAKRFEAHCKEALGLVQDVNPPCSCQRKHADNEPTVHTMWACFPEREMIRGNTH